MSEPARPHLDFAPSVSRVFASFPDLGADGNCTLSLFVRIRPTVAASFRSTIARAGGQVVGAQTISRCYVKLKVAADIGAVTSALEQMFNVCSEAGVEIEAVDLDASDADHPPWFVNLAWS